MVERVISKQELASNVIDLRDSSKLQWIKLDDLPSLTLIARHFAKRGWFFIYKKRTGEHYIVVASSIDLEKDLPAKAKWQREPD